MLMFSCLLLLILGHHKKQPAQAFTLQQVMTFASYESDVHDLTEQARKDYKQIDFALVDAVEKDAATIFAEEMSAKEFHADFNKLGQDVDTLKRAMWQYDQDTML